MYSMTICTSNIVSSTQGLPAAEVRQQFMQQDRPQLWESIVNAMEGGDQ